MRSFPGQPGAELARSGRTIRSSARAVLAAALAIGPQARAQTNDAGVYETVVVAPASAAEKAREDEAASVSVVTADRTPRSGETLPQLLSELPGVSVTRLGGLGAMATLSLRGSAANQVQVYVDGIPLNSATWGSVDLGSIPIADVERIEVYRGMSPIAFGASAIGGIVSLSSRVPRATGAKIHGHAGSFGTSAGGGEVTWASSRVRLMLAANYLQSAGDFPFFSPARTLATPGDDAVLRRENNGLSQVDGLLRAAVPVPGRREVLATLSFFHRDKGLPPYADFEAQGAHLGTRRFLGSVVYSSRDDLGAGGRLRVTAYGGTTLQRFHDLNKEIAYRPVSTRDRSLSVGATVTGGKPLTGWLRLSATTDVRHEVFSPFDLVSDTASGPPGTRVSGAVGAEAHLLVAGGALEVLPSFRVEAAHDEVVDQTLFGQFAADAVPKTYLLPIARLALIQRPRSWLTLRANGGRYARLPTMFERYGNTGRVVGNPGLRPESGLNADLGASAVLGAPERTGLTLDAALFGALVRDLIEFEQNRNAARSANVTRARLAGAELAVAGRLGRHVRLVAQATFTDARNTTEIAAYRGKQLAQRPRLRAYARPELRQLPLPFRWRLGLDAEIDVTGGNYVDPANAIPHPRRVLFGAGASLESPAGRWRLVASAQNLGDAQIFDFSGYPLPGRSLFVTLQWSSHGTGPANTPSKEIVP